MFESWVNRRRLMLMRQGGEFSPLDLSPYQWLKADAGTFQTSGGSAAVADGDPVGEWQDQSGNGRHPTQTTADNRPLLKLAQQNSLPSVRFDGSNDYLRVTHANVSQPYSLYVVARPTAFSASLSTLIDGATINRGRFFWLTGSSPRPLLINAGASLSSGQSSSTGTTYTFQSLFSGANSTVSVNGGSKATGNAGTAARNGTTIGINGNLSGEYGAVDVFEVIIFSRTLSSTEEADLLEYLRAKWGHY